MEESNNELYNLCRSPSDKTTGRSRWVRRLGHGRVANGMRQGVSDDSDLHEPQQVAIQGDVKSGNAVRM
jgi:hypothetical protein